MVAGDARVKVCVYGLWHLGSVTAACLAAAGHQVHALDPDAAGVEALRAARPPIDEPGLAELVEGGIRQGRLRFFTEAGAALPGCSVLWVTFDTPVDEDDNAEAGYVLEKVLEVMPLLDEESVVLVSSQLPVGSCEQLAQAWERVAPGRRLGFACSPENLRLGKAIETFRDPERVVIGLRDERDRGVLAALFAPLTTRILWMSLESAEMTKHALNAFLAVCVTFANEIASLCEKTGADAKEVERGLKSEARIGPRAYLAPGNALAGGTLMRDIAFLTRIAEQSSSPTPVLAAVRPSNGRHQSWPRRKLEEVLQRLAGKTVAVWGLTYKPGTDTLRRSSSVELCRWLVARGAAVRAHDPAVRHLPEDISQVELCATPEEAARNADALVVMTGWPRFAETSMAAVLPTMKAPNVLDPARVLPAATSALRGIRYFAVGAARASRFP
jgi:UDPglucose 6-dehydrogenase